MGDEPLDLAEPRIIPPQGDLSVGGDATASIYGGQWEYSLSEVDILVAGLD